MSAGRTLIGNRWRMLAGAVGLAVALPVMAQDQVQSANMSSIQDTQQMSQQGAKPSTPPVSASSSRGGESMPGLNMPEMNMPGMKMRRKKALQSEKKPQAKQQRKSPMPAMPLMPMPRSQPTEVQHLNFGNMIGTRPKPDGLAYGTEGASSMQGMNMSLMQGGSASADARSADYSDGNRTGPMTGMDMPDDPLLGMVLLDQLEYAHSAHDNSEFIDGQAWYGKSFEKLWVKAEGEVSGGRLSDLRTEVLWDHAIAPYWATQLGVRHDFGEGPDRTWAAFGVQGLASYWFDTQATLYVGEGGRTAGRLEFEYEELLTQKLFLQPKVELNLYGRDDPQRAIGAGLSDAEFGLRLRYEVRREIAPYIGVVYRQRYGHTADFARAQGESTDDLQFVAGLHAWF